MKNILNKLKGLQKYLKVLAVVMIMSALPVSGIVRANTNLMEGNVKSLNVTAGEKEYKDSTNAKVDEVVQVQLWHHNRENPKGEKVSNTKVKFDVPTAPGKTQIITGTSSSDNGNTVQGKTTVNLSMERARLNYIPGSAKYRYNKGAADGDKSCQTGFDYPAERCYVTVPISDEVVNSGVNLDSIRKGPLTGCNAYHETVIIQVRAVADVISVNKFVRHAGGSTADWKTSVDAKPGDRLDYMIRFKNEGNTTLQHVMVGDNLPKYHQYINGTTMLSNSNYPSGTKISNDNITKGGIDVGNYQPGAVGLVWFSAKLDDVKAYEKCGAYDIRNVGIVQPKGMVEYYNTAKVNINVECKNVQPETPVYDCKAVSLKELGGRKIRVSVTPTMSGKNVKVKNYIYDFGDSSTPLTTNKDTVDYEYAKDGTYTTRVKIQFTVDGKDQEVDSDRCVAPITFTSGVPTVPEQPSELPATGPTAIVGIFVATSVAGAIAYNVVYRRYYM